MGVVTCTHISDPHWEPFWQAGCDWVSPVVWGFRLSACASLMSQYNRYLTESEREKATRFRVEADRERFLLGRAGLRAIVNKLLPDAIADAELSIREHGKPFFAHPTLSDKYFNISHSGEHVLIATASVPVGVDVEQITNSVFNDIGETVCSLEEMTRVKADPALFARFWVRKEAILKATGFGLIDDLTKVPAMDGTSHCVAFNQHLFATSFQLEQDIAGCISLTTLVDNIRFVRWP